LIGAPRCDIRREEIQGERRPTALLRSGQKMKSGQKIADVRKVWVL
jgi:hypothetical protein